MACWIALPTFKDKWNLKYRDSIILRLNLGGGGGSFKMQTHANRGEGACQCEPQHINFLIEHLVHKLRARITSFFVSFIKTPVLLKIYAQ